MASHDHGGGGGVVGGVGKADVNFKDATGVSIDFGAAMKPDLGLAARFADNFHVAPSELMADAGFVPAQIQPVNYHGLDNVSLVDVDCLFRPLGPADERRGPEAETGMDRVPPAR